MRGWTLAEISFFEGPPTMVSDLSTTCGMSIIMSSGGIHWDRGD